MRTTKTAAVLLSFVLFTFILVSPGLPQSSPPPGTISVEGTWLVTYEPPGFAASDLGKSVTIRCKSPGEYEAFWPHIGKTIRFFGSATEIKRVGTRTFEDLKRDFQGMGVPDTALREATGVQLLLRAFN